MKIATIQSIAALCFVSYVSGRNNNAEINSSIDHRQLKQGDESDFQESVMRELLNDGYSHDYLQKMSEAIVPAAEHSDERDLFIRRICNIIEKIYNDGRYSCECSMKPLAPQVSYTCERYEENTSGRATYGVRYEGSFIFRYLALSIATPASVCLTELTYFSTELNGGRGGLLTFGDICIESELEIDVNPLQGEVSVSVDECNVQLGENLGTCTFCGACPNGLPGFYIDCSNIWPIPFCVPNDIPFFGGRMTDDEGLDGDSQGLDDGDSPVDGGDSFGSGVGSGVELPSMGLPNPAKLFKALDLARLMQERVKALLAEQSSSQETTSPNQGTTGTDEEPMETDDQPNDTDDGPMETDDEPNMTGPSHGATGPSQGSQGSQGATGSSQGSTGPSQGATGPSQGKTGPSQGKTGPSQGSTVPSHGTTDPSQGTSVQQIGTVQDPTGDWQPWEDTDDGPMDGNDELIETDDIPTNNAPSQGTVVQKQKSAWQPWEDTDDEPMETTNEPTGTEVPYEYYEDPEPVSTEQTSNVDSGANKGNEKGASKETKEKGEKGGSAEKQESDTRTDKGTSVKSQKDGKETTKSSSGKDKVKGGSGTMSIQNLSEPTNNYNQQMPDDSMTMQPSDTIEESNNVVSAKKNDKGEAKSSPANTSKNSNNNNNEKDDQHGPMDVTNQSGPSNSNNQQAQQYDDDFDGQLVEPPKVQMDPNQDKPRPSNIDNKNNNQQDQQYDDFDGELVEPPEVQLDPNQDPPDDDDSEKGFGPWFKGFLRKSG